MRAPAFFRRMLRGAASKRRPSVSAAAERRLRALRWKYDAAGDGEDLRRYWGKADDLSAKAANDHSVRKKLRRRSRYEAANNTYASGLADTLANETIGTGPRLQLLTEDSRMNREVERRFARWAEQVDLAGKLRTMRRAKVVDGEVFLLLKLSNKDPSGPQLDLVVREADYCTSEGVLDPRKLLPVDGIELDEFDRPTHYHILPFHPGDANLLSPENQRPKREPAERVIHYFERKRPGQCRGIPELTPALPLFAQLRRYTLATLTAAETAADFAGILESLAQAPDPEDEEQPSAMDVLDIERGMLTTLPIGWKLSQLKAEHPTTVYGDFKEQLLGEIGRCVGSPFNVIAGNSSKYNYASGRLDFQIFRRNITVERRIIECEILKRIFMAWLEAAALALVDPLVGLPPFIELKYLWRWDGFTHIDEKKTADAQAVRLKTEVSNLANEMAAEGRDWEEEIAQSAREAYERRRTELTYRKRLVDEFGEEAVASVEASRKKGPEQAKESEPDETEVGEEAAAAA